MPKIADLEALEIIARLPDDVPLKPAEAAVFVRRSKRDLERMRSPNSKTRGPDYIQGGGEESVGSNQRVTYMKGDLKVWLESLKVKDSTEAAVRRGRLFISLPSLIEPAPFWRNPAGQIAGLVEDTEIDDCIERLGVWEIEWISPMEATKEHWSSAGELESLAGELRLVLDGASHALDARILKAQLGEVI